VDIAEPRSGITVRFNLLSFLAQLSQNARPKLKAEAGSTLAEVIRVLGEQQGPELQQILLDSHGQLQGGLELTVNAQPVSGRKIAEIRLWESSKVLIIPLVGGG